VLLQTDRLTIVHIETLLQELYQITVYDAIPRPALKYIQIQPQLY